MRWDTIIISRRSILEIFKQLIFYSCELSKVDPTTTMYTFLTTLQVLLLLSVFDIILRGPWVLKPLYAWTSHISHFAVDQLAGRHLGTSDAWQSCWKVAQVHTVQHKVEEQNYLCFPTFTTLLEWQPYQGLKSKIRFPRVIILFSPQVNTLPGPSWPGRACRNFCCGNHYHHNYNLYHHRFLEEKQNSVITHWSMRNPGAHLGWSLAVCVSSPSPAKLGDQKFWTSIEYSKSKCV